MKVEIWSDIVCPFCYIGKSKFDTALNQFADKNNIEIEWKSYQLMPGIETQLDKNVHQILAEHKGFSVEQAKQMNDQVTQIAKQVGLEYNFDKAIVPNTLKAHEFLHFAKQNGKQNEAEALLFKAYFTDGKNVDDTPTLLELGKSIGLDESDLKQALDEKTFANDVQQDIYEAQQVGVRGVPFFVFDRKYAVSGAQDPEAFLEILERSFGEWKQQNPETKLEISEGQSCDINGNCN